MVVKLITVYLKPGRREAYLAAQRIWNRETGKAPGYLGCFCGQDPGEPDVLRLQFFWRTREELKRWMDTDHDRIAALAGADEHYERIEVRVLDDLFATSMLPGGLADHGSAEAADLQTWCEAYRAPIALRHGVRVGLFDRLASGPVELTALASQMGVDAAPLEKLLHALGAMGLVTTDTDGWRNTGLAQRTLVQGAPGYQGDMVLHSTQPEYIERMYTFGERLGLSPDKPDPQAYHPRFVQAMANTAAAGQADALLAAVDLTDCRTLLDIGGATGPYSIALCRAYPQLRAVVLDQEPTRPLAEAALKDAGLGDRVRFEVHDYRTGPFPGPVDAVLISNVLRGETPALIDDLLQRVHDALSPGGRVVIPDLYVEEPPANPGLRATLFGLHLPDGANCSTQQVAEAVERAGFTSRRIERLAGAVVMNAVVEARKSSENDARPVLPRRGNR
ncbi:MAG: DUF4937 domain-containing protein [bacterium]|nr:DUF4937 domain-containing protein [bacterium]